MWIKIFTISLAFTQLYTASINPICATKVTNDFNPFSCCQLPSSNLEHIQDISAECILAFKNQSEHGNEFNMTKSELNCYGECVLKKTGLLKNQVFQLDVGVDFVLKTFYALEDESPLKSLVHEAFEICDSRARYTQYLNSHPEEGACSDFSIYWFGCVDTHIYKNCPADMWNTGASCNKFKANSKHCLIFDHYLTDWGSR